jgi:two-component system, sensor histidine kinase and response regulator
LLRHAPEEYAVITAADGKLGCEQAAIHQPDLIIMDWVMPEMNGLEALLFLKEREETRDIPVIMLTGLGSSKHVEFALNAGAADYLRIPIEKIELLARVRATLALSDSYRRIKEQSQRLEEQNQELIALNQLKNEFLGIAAHDLKNPLSNIADLARIIEREAETAPLTDVQEFARLIGQSSNKMVELVSNLLDINALERGTVPMTLAHVDVVAIANRVVEAYTQRAVQKSIQLFFAYLPDIEHHSLETSFENSLFAHADAGYTEQIIENLVSNAVKYSPHGKSVWVSVSAEAVRAEITTAEAAVHNAVQDTVQDAGRVLVSVRDEGPGISPHDMTKMFEKFTRLSAQPTGGEHSTGLGLSIVKKLAESMNGSVWCESVLGSGATFTLALPRASQ